MKKTGIMGGTFNPPHNGHVYSALKFYDLLGLDELYIMPDSTPPHKTIIGDDTPLIRYEMCKSAFSEKYIGTRNITVCDYEIRKGGTSYTYLTLEHFYSKEGELFLYCGEDMFLTLDSWKNPEKIFALSTPVCCRRDSSDETSAKVEEKRVFYKDKFGKDSIILRYAPLEMSSTDIRQAIFSGESVDGFVCPEVLDIIRHEMLYTDSEKQLSELREAIKPIVGKRITHILSTEQEAFEMSKLTDMTPREVYELRVAALLHDITHAMEIDEQLWLCRKCGVTPDPEFLLAPPTLHSQSGPCYAKIHFPEYATTNVCRIILSHTVGRERMTPSEKILCLADFTEKTRKYESCQAMRNAFWNAVTQENFTNTLNESLLQYFNITEENCIKKGEHLNSLMLKSKKALEKELKNNK